MDTILWYYFIVFLLFFGLSLFHTKFTYRNPNKLLISIVSTWALLAVLTAFFLDREFVIVTDESPTGFLPISLMWFYGCFSFASTMLFRTLIYNFTSFRLNKQVSSYIFVGIMTLLCLLVLLFYNVLFSTIILLLNIFTLGYLYNKKPHVFQWSFLGFLIMVLLFVVLPYYFEVTFTHQVLASTAFNFLILGHTVEWVLLLFFAFHFVLLWDFKKSKG